MTILSRPARCAAACLLFAIQAAVAAEPGAAPQSAEAADRLPSADVSVVADAAPALQKIASAPAGAAAAPLPRTAVDWSHTPRRSLPARRR